VEPPTIFADYIDPAFRERAPRIVEEHRPPPWMPYRLEAETIGLSDDTPPAQLARRGARRGSDPAAHLRDLRKEGIQVAVLYPSLALSLGWIADPALAAACCRAYNRWLADFCSFDPQSLLGVAAVPFQHPMDAVAELSYGVERLGLRGVFVRPNPHAGKRLDDRSFDPFWSAVQELGCPVGLHEGTTRTMRTIGQDRYDDPFRLHVVSHVMEGMLACMDVIVGGVLERFPRLKVIVLETGGGWICPWLSRLDHQFEKMGVLRPPLQEKPSHYFKRQCWISFDPDEPMLRPTVEWLGSERVLWASDYPHFDSCVPGAVATLEANLAGLPDQDRRNVLGANAAGLYPLL
jgi:predicted TIM-barrel fold metal-dependent hydrolase